VTVNVNVVATINVAALGNGNALVIRADTVDDQERSRALPFSSRTSRTSGPTCMPLTARGSDGDTCVAPRTLATV